MCAYDDHHRTVSGDEHLAVLNHHLLELSLHSAQRLFMAQHFRLVTSNHINHRLAAHSQHRTHATHARAYPGVHGVDEVERLTVIVVVMGEEHQNLARGIGGPDQAAQDELGLPSSGLRRARVDDDRPACPPHQHLHRTRQSIGRTPHTAHAHRTRHARPWPHTHEVPGWWR